MLRLRLPPRGTLRPNNEVDPLRFYYRPLVGRVFRARIDAGLALLDGLRFERLLEIGYGSGLLMPTLATIARELHGADRLLHQHLEALRCDLLEELVLAPKMRVDAARGEAEPLGEGPDRDALRPLVRDDAQRHLHDPLSRNRRTAQHRLPSSAHITRIRPKSN